MPSVQSRFPRISSYGFLSDCHTGALVSPEGSVEWLCLPRFDSESVFGSILDRSAGFWRIGPPGLVAPVSRRYEPGTNVLETTWMTGSGWIMVRDALTLGDWRPDNDFEPHRRPPPDDEAEHVLIRTVECLQGEVDVENIEGEGSTFTIRLPARIARWPRAAAAQRCLAGAVQRGARRRTLARGADRPRPRRQGRGSA